MSNTNFTNTKYLSGLNRGPLKYIYMYKTRYLCNVDHILINNKIVII